MGAEVLRPPGEAQFAAAYPLAGLGPLAPELAQPQARDSRESEGGAWGPILSCVSPHCRAE